MGLLFILIFLLYQIGCDKMEDEAKTEEERYLMMMVVMYCFCGMVDRRKAFSLTSSRDHCQRSSPSRISKMPRVEFEPAQNLSYGFVE